MAPNIIIKLLNRLGLFLQQIMTKTHCGKANKGKKDVNLDLSDQNGAAANENNSHAMVQKSLK